MKPTLRQNMSTSPMTARHKDDLAAAYMRMKREGYRHLLVIDDQGDLVGIISDRDFQRAMWPTTTVTDAHGLPDTPQFSREAKVAHYMSHPVTTLPEETSLLTAVEMMIEKKISAIAVTRNERMIGILTTEDLLRVLKMYLKDPSVFEVRALGLSYSSPLSKVADLLAAAGI